MHLIVLVGNVEVFFLSSCFARQCYSPVENALDLQTSRSEVQVRAGSSVICEDRNMESDVEK